MCGTLWRCSTHTYGEAQEHTYHACTARCPGSPIQPKNSSDSIFRARLTSAHARPQNKKLTTIQLKQKNKKFPLTKGEIVDVSRKRKTGAPTRCKPRSSTWRNSICLMAVSISATVLYLRPDCSARRLLSCPSNVAFAFALSPYIFPHPNNRNGRAIAGHAKKQRASKSRAA